MSSWWNTLIAALDLKVGYLSRLPVACNRNVTQESNIKHIAAAFVDLEPDLINMAGFLLPFKREGKIKNGVLPNFALKDKFHNTNLQKNLLHTSLKIYLLNSSKWRGFSRDIFRQLFCSPRWGTSPNPSLPWRGSVRLPDVFWRSWLQERGLRDFQFAICHVWIWICKCINSIWYCFI